MTENEKFGLQALKGACSAEFENTFTCMFKFYNGNLVQVEIDKEEEQIIVSLWRDGKKIVQVETRDRKLAKHLCGSFAKKECEE